MHKWKQCSTPEEIQELTEALISALKDKDVKLKIVVVEDKDKIGYGKRSDSVDGPYFAIDTHIAAGVLTRLRGSKPSANAESVPHHFFLAAVDLQVTSISRF